MSHKSTNSEKEPCFVISFGAFLFLFVVFYFLGGGGGELLCLQFPVTLIILRLGGKTSWCTAPAATLVVYHGDAFEL